MSRNNYSWPISHLSLLVDSDNARGGFVRGGDKDGLCTDPVHVDADSRLQVIQVNVAILCDQIDDAVLIANLGRMIRDERFYQLPTLVYHRSSRRPHLHSYRKVRLGLWRKEHIHCFLSEWLVSCSWLTNFNDVQLEEESHLSYFQA